MLALAGFASAGFVPASHSSDAPDQLDTLVQDLCPRRIVLLGEDSGHGAGATLAMKAELVRRLVDQCRFKAVAFESPIYDFLDYEARIAAAKATPAHLSDAIGGLWSTTAEMQPLIGYLHERALNDGIALLGLDLQLAGATQSYAQRKLPGELAAALPDSHDRESCSSEIGRLTRWEYDATHPNNADTAKRLSQCAAAVATAASTHDDSRTVWMARNLQEYLRMQAGDGEARSRAMHANLEWHLARMPALDKVIVWTGAIHAARKPLREETDRRRFGVLLADSRGPGIASIAFTSVGGEHGRQGITPQSLAKPEPGTLEDMFAPTPADHFRYVSGAQLAQAGTRVGRAIRYSRSQAEDWGELFDGVVVLGAERAPTYIRPPAPLQQD